MSDAPVVSLESGRAIYRASALGTCDRALIAARMGMTPAAPPDWLQAKFDEGHRNEPIIMDALSRLKEIGPIHDPQATVELDIDEHAAIRGHIDGVEYEQPTPDVTRVSATHVVEAKALGRSLCDEWAKGPDHFFAAHPGYRDQLTVYMTATGLPALYVVMDKEASTDGDVALRIEEITEPPGDIDAIRDRLHQIDEQGRAGDLPVDCPNPSFPCPFYYLPGHESKASQPDNTDMFAALAAEAVEAREDKKRAEARAKEANARLLQHMTLLGEEKLSGSGYVVTKVSSKSTSFDRKAMEADGVLEKYRQVSEYQYVKATREGD